MYHAAPGGGTVCYLAPEVLRGDDPHTSADMWSLGALITYIANDRRHLFRRERDVFNWRGGQSPMRRQFQYPLHDLVLSLLSVNKHKRPTAEQVDEHLAYLARYHDRKMRNFKNKSYSEDSSDSSDSEDIMKMCSACTKCYFSIVQTLLNDC